jgi:phage baseplate assembly protein W
LTRKFAEDDANLDLGSIITARNRKYSDLNLLFERKPGSGDVYLSKDAGAVKQSVKNIVLTQFYERPYRPYVGADVRSMLFENITLFSSNTMKEKIISAIQNYEPRAAIQQVLVREAGSNSISVIVEFKVVGTAERVTLNVELDRLR